MARQGFPSDKQDQFVIRFPDGMRDRIKAAAEANGRSMNAEIIHRLETTFQMDDYVPEVNAHPDTSSVIDLGGGLIVRLSVERLE